MYLLQNIYLFSCKTYGLEYVGSTVEKFHFTRNNYKNCHMQAVQRGTPPQSLFHHHFLKERHHSLVNDCKITLTNKTNSSDPRRWEFFWIKLLKIYYPNSLNVKEQL